MKYPLADTPMNRKLEGLIDECSGDKMIISSEMSDYTFHALPIGEIKGAWGRDEWDLEIDYKCLYVAAINKSTGGFGLTRLIPSNPSMRGVTPEAVDIKSTLDALRRNDIKSLYCEAPHLFNIGMNSKNELTYLDHYQDLVTTGDAKREAYNTEIKWLIENGHKRAGSAEAPEEITRAVEKTISDWWGDLNEEGNPSSSHRMTIRFNEFKELPYLIGRDFDSTSLMGVSGYTSDPATRSMFKDVGRNFGDGHNRDGRPEVMLDLPLEYYHKGADDIYESISHSFDKACELFRDKALNGYRDALEKSFMEKRGDISESDIRKITRRVVSYLHNDASFTKLLVSPTPQESRNKLQVLDIFGGSERAFDILMQDKKIKKGVEEGRPMKEVLDHLPLLNTSKKTILSFLHNFKEYLDYEGSPVKLITEKGVSVMDKLNPGTTSAINQNAIALITTLPEAHLVGDDRSADKMINVLAGFPHLIDTLSHRFIQAREGKANIKNLMAWAPGELDTMDKRHHTVRDAEHIFNNNYYATVVHHLSYLQDLDLPHGGHKIRKKSMYEGVRNLLRSTIEAGEYRAILAFDDEIHRDVHQLFKLGKPNADIIWERTVDKDFERNGYRISPITNNADLSEEGAELNHCVGSYLRKVLDNQSYIFSVTKEGRRVSTIEIKGQDLGDDELYMVQHFAHGNTKPPEDAIEAAKTFLSAINSKEISFERSPCSSELLDSYFDESMALEREEVEFGLRFTDREFVIHTVDSMNRILPSFDIWGALEKEQLPSHLIDDLKRDFEHHHGVEKGVSSQ